MPRTIEREFPTAADAVAAVPRQDLTQADAPLATGARTRRKLLLGGLGAWVLSPSIARAADEYPSKPITMILPFAAGGSTDRLFRTLAAHVGKELGQTLVLDSRSGAGGLIAAQQLARANPDGYTIGQYPIYVARQNQLGRTPLDMLNDFTPIATVAVQTSAMIVRTESRFKSIADLVGYAKANPGKVTYGSPGVGTATYVGMEDFSQMAGIEMLHVPYKGGAVSMNALMGGEVDLLSESGLYATHVTNGKLRMLSVWANERLARFPDVPTMKELGYNIVSQPPVAIGAPKGMDPKSLAKLELAFKNAAASPEFRREAESIEALVRFQSSSELRQLAKDQVEWERQMIKRLNLKEKMKAG